MGMNKINWPSWPQFGKDEKLAVERVIQSNQLFAANEVKTFEKEYADYNGCRYALGLGNSLGIP